jgi:hypothetical protein
MGTMGSFPGVKRPGREADHSPPSSAEVKECVDRNTKLHRDRQTDRQTPSLPRIFS